MRTLGVPFDQFRLADFIHETVAAKKDQSKEDSLVLQMGRDGKSSMNLEGEVSHPNLHRHLQEGKGLFFHFHGPYGFLLQMSGETLFINSALHAGTDRPVPTALVEITEECKELEETMKSYIHRFMN